MVCAPGVWMDRWNKVWRREAMCSCASGIKYGLTHPAPLSRQNRPCPNTHTHTHNCTPAQRSLLGLDSLFKEHWPSTGTNSDGCRVMTDGTMQQLWLQLKPVQHFNLCCKQCSSCPSPNSHTMERTNPPDLEGNGHLCGPFGTEPSVARKVTVEPFWEVSQSVVIRGSKRAWPGLHILSTATSRKRSVLCHFRWLHSQMTASRRMMSRRYSCYAGEMSA